MAEDKIRIYGAREHNLRDISLQLPRGELIVFCGVSGSGKSSLAFDTIYAEGQRRYVESLSTHARQFLGGMSRPAVDHIDGLSPAIAIDQQSASSNPRSTVATLTEIYDYLRVLLARTGQPYCVTCNIPIRAATPQMITDQIMALGEGTRLMVLAPVRPAPEETWKHVVKEARRGGFARLRVDGEVLELDGPVDIAPGDHTCEVVVDRLVISEKVLARLADSVETALAQGNGHLVVAVLPEPRPSVEPAPEGPAVDVGRGQASAGPAVDVPTATDGDGNDRGNGGPAEARPLQKANDTADDTADGPRDLRFSTHYACSQCSAAIPELTPQLFSFNSPHGMCPTCNGLGYVRDMDPDRFVADPGKSILQGALSPLGDVRGGHLLHTLQGLAAHYNFDLDTPWRELPAEVREVVLFGSGGEEMAFSYETQRGRPVQYRKPFRGLIAASRKRYDDTESQVERNYLERYLSELPCPACGGQRLRPEALAVRFGGRSISEITTLDVAGALEFFAGVELSANQGVIATEVLKEITARLRFMVEVGVGYLGLDRPAPTLSGGEAQRIRLATQMGSGLAGVLYILDEPSIGLHPRDQEKLLGTICQLRDLGNTVIVVEHDVITIENADYVVEFGPGAGVRGGEVTYAGDVAGMKTSPKSLTGRYLSGELAIGVPKFRRQARGGSLKVVGACEHNLQHVNVEIPLGTLTCITGVSGSGKSTLVHDVICQALRRTLHRSRDAVGRHERLEGLEHLDKVINIDQSPIGRTPRSNPATYAHLFGPIRELFAATPEAQVRGYKPGRFSFNVRGGRCELCQGDGTIRVEMHFLPAVFVPCEQCGGTRYNRETLQIRYKGKNIAEILDLTVAEALEHFENVPQISRVLRMLYDVGLDYVKLGQSGTTLSGGEAQRLKLARELAKIGTGRTLYVLDEPTTGLHFADIEKLLQVVERLVDAGNTVLVIEHNLDVIKTADYVIDLGPEGGVKGGEILACGTPEQIVASPRSYTGQYLREVLGRS